MNQPATIPIPCIASDAMSPPSTGDASDARALSARIAAGDEAAFRTLYDAYAGRVRRFVLALARGDEAVADEVVQQPVVKSEWDKTPRNAPCPCGSGKKFKMCHGAT